MDVWTLLRNVTTFSRHSFYTSTYIAIINSLTLQCAENTINELNSARCCRYHSEVRAVTWRAWVGCWGAAWSSRRYVTGNFSQKIRGDVLLGARPRIANPRIRECGGKTTFYLRTTIFLMRSRFWQICKAGFNDVSQWPDTDQNETDQKNMCWLCHSQCLRNSYMVWACERRPPHYVFTLFRVKSTLWRQPKIENMIFWQKKFVHVVLDHMNWSCTKIKSIAPKSVASQIKTFRHSLLSLFLVHWLCTAVTGRRKWIRQEKQEKQIIHEKRDLMIKPRKWNTKWSNEPFGDDEWNKIITATGWGWSLQQLVPLTALRKLNLIFNYESRLCEVLQDSKNSKHQNCRTA